MTFLEWVGLVFLVAETAIADGVLVYDLYLLVRFGSAATISSGVWAQLKAWRAWRRYHAWLCSNDLRAAHRPPRAPQVAFPWRAVYLPAAMLFGPVGLAIHFFS